jgi:Raf kinase inhibitor-like YbhB/YbcL family protein
MQLSSPAFEKGGCIPMKYTADGEDISPPLAWDQVPAGTKEFVLVCDDPDAPTPRPWVHWILYGIPAATRTVSEDGSQSAEIPGVQGKNSWKAGKTIGYRGPAPPPGHGVHHYHFRLYALDTTLTLPPGKNKEAVLEAIQSHILAEAEFVATYQRK